MGATNRGGPAVLLDDFDQATSSSLPAPGRVLVMVTFLVLLLLFRAPCSRCARCCSTS